ncbi:MAG: transposase [Nitrospirota bacterium]|nr:transposase [Nitrospirota bacterium]MDH5774136.1 transposase [Nitrospirota bacterium]
MKRYPPERKAAVLKKMVPPSHGTIAALSEAEGISEATLYNWRRAARAEGRLLPDGDQTPAGWGTREKFAGPCQVNCVTDCG